MSGVLLIKFWIECLAILWWAFARSERLLTFPVLVAAVFTPFIGNPLVDMIDDTALPPDDRCERRNDILFVWHNVPMPYMPLHLAGTTLNRLLDGLRVGHPFRMARGTASESWACLYHLGRRAPVSREAYRLSRCLKKQGIQPWMRIEPLLPPISPARS